MCTLGFKGRGYSPDFVRNYRVIHKTLNNDENTVITVTEYMDSICTACPHKLDETLCRSQHTISQLDMNHAKILKLSPGEKMTWKEAKVRIKENMTVAKFHKACSVCRWKKYGVCQKSLESLLHDG